MTDIFTKEKRSEVMSKIRGKNTKLELDFMKALSREVWPLGYRYRKHYKKVPGRPDVAFPKYRLAVFVDGDFWHGYDFPARRKKLNGSYWPAKIEANIARDSRNDRDLRKLGWKVLRFWEHEVKKKPDRAIGKIRKFLEKAEAKESLHG